MGTVTARATTRNAVRVSAPALLAFVTLASGACSGEDKNGVTDTVAPPDDSIFIPDVTVFDTLTSEPETTTAPDVVVEDVPPQPGEFGYECDENSDCNSGYCVQTASGRTCTQTCADTCPGGYDCRLAPGTDATFVCLPRFLHLCDPCRETSECNEGGGAGNYCLGYGPTGRFCGVACEQDDQCPDSYVCRNVPVGGGAEAKQCVPEDGAECKCSEFAKQAQRATTCFVENDNGKCEGTRFCLQSGLSLCDAATPFPESCNQLDDNCNDQKDEFPPDYVCEITNEFGSCPGTGSCIDGVESCQGTAPAPDVCDLIDNDCDGDTDEDVCDDGDPCTTDTCNPENGDCLHTNDDTRLCDDGNVCTQIDKCTGGTCTGYNPVSCGDGNPCKSWQCDPVVGCLSSFNDAGCEDGNPCTVSDKCNLGVCVSGGPNTCDDGNECTTDSCQAGVGCKHDNLTNGTGCQLAGGATQCSTGVCQNGACVGSPIREGLDCTYPGGAPACKVSRCNGGLCKLNNQSPGVVCGNEDVCPPCVDLLGSIFDCCFGLLEVNVAKRCDSQGSCTVTDTPNVTCGSTSCGGSCAGSCLPACGIGICLQ